MVKEEGGVIRGTVKYSYLILDKLFTQVHRVSSNLMLTLWLVFAPSNPLKGVTGCLACGSD